MPLSATITKDPAVAASFVDGFRAARGNIYQTLLVKPERGVSGLPLTRGDWYS